MKSHFSRRDFLRISMSVVGGGLLASCAPQAPTAAPQPTKAAEEPVEAPSSGAESLAGKTYVMWGLEFDPHIEKYKLIAEEFEKRTGAKGTVEPQGWPLETKVLAAIAGGNAPDIACVMGKMLAPLVREDALISLDNAFMEIDVDPVQWFTPGSIVPYRYGGKYYGVPVEDNQVASFLIAREDWIKEAGVESLWPAMRDGDPWFADYDELWEVCTRLQKKDDSGNVTVWGYSGSGWDLQQFGGICRMLDHKWWDLDSKTFAMDADAAVEAIQTHIGNPVDAGIETNLQDSGQNTFAQGKVAVARGNMGIIPEAEKNGIPVVGAIAPPLKKGEKPLFTGEGGWGFILPKGSKNSDVGIELAKFLTTLEGNSLWMDIYGGILPPLYAERDLPFWQEPKSKTAQMVKSWFPAQELTDYYPEGLGYYGPYETAYGQVVATVRSGEIKAKEAATQLQKLFNEVYQEWTKGE